MTLLEAINSCLTALGEARVTSENVRHPTVDIVRSTIELKRRALLERGWWFNVADVTMYPGVDGTMEYPFDALSIVGYDSRSIIARDNLLFDLDNNTRVFTGPLKMRVTYDLEFHNLPESAATVVWTKAAQEVYAGDYGVDSVVQRLNMQELNAMQTMDMLHLRNRRYSTRDHRGFRRIVSALRN